MGVTTKFMKTAKNDSVRGEKWDVDAADNQSDNSLPIVTISGVKDQMIWINTSV